jgi:Ca2+/Na+ antiporter
MIDNILVVIGLALCLVNFWIIAREKIVNKRSLMLMGVYLIVLIGGHWLKSTGILTILLFFGVTVLILETRNRDAKAE